MNVFKKLSVNCKVVACNLQSEVRITNFREFLVNSMKIKDCHFLGCEAMQSGGQWHRIPEHSNLPKSSYLQLV
jgi:hypothetical protein